MSWRQILSCVPRLCTSDLLAHDHIRFCEPRQSQVCRVGLPFLLPIRSPIYRGLTGLQDAVPKPCPFSRTLIRTSTRNPNAPCWRRKGLQITCMIDLARAPQGQAGTSLGRFAAPGAAAAACYMRNAASADWRLWAILMAMGPRRQQAHPRG